MTMRMYAKRKGWPADKISVELTQAKKYVTDCEACEDEPVKMDVIDRTITLGYDLDEDQRQTLM